MPELLLIHRTLVFIIFKLASASNERIKLFEKSQTNSTSLAITGITKLPKIFSKYLKDYSYF